MNTVGSRTLRKVAQQVEDASSLSKGSTSLFRRASQVQPMGDAFIGGWHQQKYKILYKFLNFLA